MVAPQLEMFGYDSKAEVVRDSIAYWNPNKTQFWIDEEIPLIIGKREGYVLTDIDGHSVFDVHLNGGTFNLGHRNPEVIASLVNALNYVDVGNHHFPAPGRAALAKRLVELTPGSSKVVFGSSGGEIVDLAIKSARFATGRRKVVSIQRAYHGHTGLSIATGDERFSRLFHSDNPTDFVQVPFNDIDAMRDALSGHDVAAVILETVPATYGFPMPKPGYLAATKQACEATGALYIADEVQTGLGRTGHLWGIYAEGVEPDIIVTGKGLGGGVYPMSAAILNERSAAWLDRDGFAHMSTFGGAELGCAVASTTLDITLRQSTQENIQARIAQFREGLHALQHDNPDTLIGIRQNGLVIGLEFSGPGAKPVMSELYRRGVWAIFSTLDPQVLQFKPGLLMTEEEATHILDILAGAVKAVTVGV